MSETIVKKVNFGVDARNAVMAGIEKLAKAVQSTLGASGKCVLLEDGQGKPVITKDGVSVAEAITLLDPVENMGARLIKQAAKKTVEEAGDGTTTATVLAYAILLEALKQEHISIRDLKAGIDLAVEEVIKYLERRSVPVKGDMLHNVASISANNDIKIGGIIAEAFKSVDLTGVVTMEITNNEETTYELSKGGVFDSGLKSRDLATNETKDEAILEKPYVLLSETKIESIRKIQSVLETTIKSGRALLIIADVEKEVLNTLTLNKLKGAIKVNVIDPPYYGPLRKEKFNDLALITGATVINEDLGDDLDLIDASMLGEVIKTTTSTNETIFTIDSNEDIKKAADKIKEDLRSETDGMKIQKLERRLGLLEGKIAVVKVGAETEVELKELADRVEDAICAVKAAVKEGIVAGGGVALLNASVHVKAKSDAMQVLLDAIKAPYLTILDNAGIDTVFPQRAGMGLNVINGKNVNMVKAGIIDPLLVTKSALKNAASVATTILSTDCVINNLRA